MHLFDFSPRPSVSIMNEFPTVLLELCFALAAVVHPLHPELCEVARLGSAVGLGSAVLEGRTFVCVLVCAGVNLTGGDCMIIVTLLVLHPSPLRKDLFETVLALVLKVLLVLTAHSFSPSPSFPPNSLLLCLSSFVVLFAYILLQAISDQQSKLRFNNEEICAMREELTSLRGKLFSHDITELKMTRSRSSNVEMDVMAKLKKMTPRREKLEKIRSAGLNKFDIPKFRSQFTVDDGIGSSMSGSEVSVGGRKETDLKGFSSGESSISTMKDTDLSHDDINEIMGSIMSQEYVLWQHIQTHPSTDSNILLQLQQLTSSLPSVSRSTFNPKSIERIPLFTLMEENEELAEVMSRLGEWDFNTLELVRCTGEPLKEVSYYLFSTHSIPEKFGVSRSALVKFLREVEKRYKKTNFYHNSLHAADVLNSVVFLLSSGLHRCGHFLDLEVFSLFIASIGHDISHPGVNNAFLINNSDPLALKYNDKSVLEMMHSAAVFGIIRRQECNILGGLCLGDFQRARKVVVELILATDLQRHFGLQSEYRRELEEEKKTLDDEEFRLKTLEICIKCGDLGHGAKETSIHLRWTYLISHEFFSQGDKELSLGLPLSPLCDRHSVLIPNSQIGFLTVMVKPLFDLWDEMVRNSGDWDESFTELPFQLCSRHISENLQYWESEVEQTIETGCEFVLPDVYPPMLGV